MKEQLQNSVAFEKYETFTIDDRSIAVFKFLKILNDQSSCPTSLQFHFRWRIHRSTTRAYLLRIGDKRAKYKHTDFLIKIALKLNVKVDMIFQKAKSGVR